MAIGMAAPPLRIDKEPKLVSSKLRVSIGIEVVLLHLLILLGPVAWNYYLNSQVPEESPFRVKLVGALSTGEELGAPERRRVTANPGPPAPPDIPVRNVAQPDQPQLPVRNVSQPDQPQLPVRNVSQPDQPRLPVRNVAQPDQPKLPVNAVVQPVVAKSDRERIAEETRRRAQAQTEEARKRANEDARRQKLLDDARKQQATAEAQKRKAAAEARERAAANQRAIEEARRLAQQRSGGGSNTNIAVPIGNNDRAQARGPQNNATPGGGAEGETQAYWDRLKRYVDMRWAEPPDSLLAGARPQVTFLLSVAADGRVISARITSLSGNRSMDDSVKRMLENLDRVPAPQNGSFTVEMILRAKD